MRRGRAPTCRCRPGRSRTGTVRRGVRGWRGRLRSACTASACAGRGWRRPAPASGPTKSAAMASIAESSAAATSGSMSSSWKPGSSGTGSTRSSADPSTGSPSAAAWSTRSRSAAASPRAPDSPSKDLAEPAQRPVLGDPNGAGSRPDRLRGLLRRQPDRQPQHQDLALTGSQVREELAQPGGHLGGEQAVLGAVRGDRAVRQVRHRLGAVAPDRPEGVGHLVRGDAVDEGPERQALELVVRQRADDRHADVLRDVVRGAHERLLAPEAGAAVLQHERMDQREKVVAGPGVATDRACDQRVDHRAGVGLPLGWGDRLVRAGRDQARGFRWPGR